MSADLLLVAARTFWELNIDVADTRKTVSEPDLDLLRVAELDCKDGASSVASCATSAGSEGSARGSISDSEDERPSPAPVGRAVREPGVRCEARGAEAKRRRGCRAGARGGHRLEKAEPSQETRTSVLVTNLSRSASREDLLRLLQHHGLQQACDFLYLPVDFRDGLPCGYAFLNFGSHGWAQAAIQQLHGRAPAVPALGADVLSLAWTTGNQGLEALVNRYRNSPVMQGDMPEAWRPMLFCAGRRVAFPAPTKKVKSARNLA